MCTGVLCGVRERGTVVRVYWGLVWGEGMRYSTVVRVYWGLVWGEGTRYCGTCVLGSCVG